MLKTYCLGRSKDLNERHAFLIANCVLLRFRYEDYIASPLCPIIIAVTFYFISILPWMVIDLYGKNWTWIYKYKIQPDVEVTWPMVKKAVVLTTWNNVS